MTQEIQLPRGHEALVVALKAEAEACRESATCNGEYNRVFWVVAIVLESMAQRLGPSDEAQADAGAV